MELKKESILTERPSISSTKVVFSASTAINLVFSEGRVGLRVAQRIALLRAQVSKGAAALLGASKANHNVGAKRRTEARREHPVMLNHKVCGLPPQWIAN
ncbi:hypothetical protein PIIN_11598 [Serendipita indica DSM 11827]|uniref:Uncharacterized protein n=1 Tax=Serendipita indica (strain DSM 11827) TaxID=1109443 RepID=G4U228_SERID|nr:hypothetical protein PIIN_11598 [Serendipita indica DSM 11827]